MILALVIHDELEAANELPGKQIVRARHYHNLSRVLCGLAILMLIGGRPLTYACVKGIL